MDSTQCSLLLVSPVDTGHSNTFPYIDLLRSVFKQVGVIHDDERTLRRKYPSSTVFMIDLDVVLDQDDQASVSSSGSSCTFTMDTRLTWTKRITQLLVHHPVIVCSSETNGTFMLDCLHAGAADYLLKPLYQPVLQTLFLKLHRRQGPEPHSMTTTASSSSNDAPLDLSSTASNTTTLHLDDDCLFLQQDDIHHRFKTLVTKDSQLTKAMMDIYAPPLPFPAKYIPLSSREADELKDKLASWDFSPFDYQQDELIHCVYLIFETALAAPELAHISLSQDQWYDFIIDLASAYHDDNPYHNFAHAVDVLQCMFYFLTQLGCFPWTTTKSRRAARTRPLLSAKQVFSILLSAIGHDAGHPGVNNLFLINSRTPLAVMYNDRSVLESLHSMTLFQLIKKHRLDQWWSAQDYQQFRHTIISSILATDMALNNDYVAKFRAQVASSDDANDKTTKKRVLVSDLRDDPMLVCTALIKCADISNVTRPFARGKQWAQLLVEEFASQGDLEKELGMPVQPTNDREKIVLEDFQIGFIRFVAMDLFTAVVDLLPELRFTVQQMQQNLDTWEEKKKNKANNNAHELNATIAPAGIPNASESPIAVPNTTAGTKRRLSYCLESSTPPSLSSNGLLSTATAQAAAQAANNTSHHYHQDASPCKKPQHISPASTPPLSTSSASSTASNSTASSSSCLLQ
ncbi:hypothetical protein BC940DRAFT_288803 [Gongronella butleri]|nr:hypothetical protein BC940DRAFT_288803 [Gongronella butleri]